MKRIKKLPKATLENALLPRDTNEITSKDFQNLLDSTRKQEEILTKIFLVALYKRDGASILRLAHSVEFFKESLVVHPVDQERQKLLFLRRIFEAEKISWPIREIADFLGYKPAEDGFSALRRKCKQLGVPFLETRKINRK